MKFYITVENVPKLKRSFLNLKLYSIISINQILEEFDYTYENLHEYANFLVNKRILSLINTYVKSKRIRGIIYSNEFINKDIINNIFDILEPIDKIEDIVLLDDYNIPVLKEYYNHFNEVMFFPSIRKIRLIECKPIKEPMEWK